jgi:hypothetical protein
MEQKMKTINKINLKNFINRKFIILGIIAFLSSFVTLCSQTFEALKISEVEGLRSVSSVNNDDPSTFPRVTNIQGNTLQIYTDANEAMWNFMRFEITFSKKMDKASIEKSGNIVFTDVDNTDFPTGTFDGTATNFSDAVVSLTQEGFIAQVELHVFSGCIAAPCTEDAYADKNAVNEIFISEDVKAENGQNLIGNIACDKNYCEPNNFRYVWTGWFNSSGNQVPPAHSDSGIFPDGAKGFTPNDSLYGSPAFTWGVPVATTTQIDIAVNLADFDDTLIQNPGDESILTANGVSSSSLTGVTAVTVVGATVTAGNISAQFTGLTHNTMYTVAFNKAHTNLKSIYYYPNGDCFYCSLGNKTELFIDRFQEPPGLPEGKMGKTDFERVVWTIFDTIGGTVTFPSVLGVTDSYSYGFVNNSADLKLKGGGGCYSQGAADEGDYINDSLDNAVYVGPGNGDWFWNGSCVPFVYKGGETSFDLNGYCYTSVEDGYGDYIDGGTGYAQYVGPYNGNYVYYNSYYNSYCTGNGSTKFEGVAGWDYIDPGRGTYDDVGGNYRYQNGYVGAPGMGTYSWTRSSYRVEFSELINHSTLTTANIRAYYENPTDGNLYQISNPSLVPTDIITGIPGDPNEKTYLEIINPDIFLGDIVGFTLSSDITDAGNGLTLDGNGDFSLQGAFDYDGDGRYDDFFYCDFMHPPCETVPIGP